MRKTAANGKPGASPRSENTQALGSVWALRQLTPAAPVTWGQLCPCCLWNAGNAGLRKDNNLHALMLSGHPHEACDLP